MSRIILVCGGRDYDDYNHVAEVLSQHVTEHDIVVQGGAAGADRWARDWCTFRGIPCATVPANWGRYGKAAGYARNAGMLRLKPDLVVAFPGGKGTAMMVDLARKAGVQVIEIH